MLDDGYDGGENKYKMCPVLDHLSSSHFHFHFPSCTFARPKGGIPLEPNPGNGQTMLGQPMPGTRDQGARGREVCPMSVSENRGRK